MTTERPGWGEAKAHRASLGMLNRPEVAEALGVTKEMVGFLVAQRLLKKVQYEWNGRPHGGFRASDVEALKTRIANQEAKK